MTTGIWGRVRGLRTLGCLAAAFVISFVVGVSQSHARGNCAPGYPVCWFSAACSTRCVRHACVGLVCDDFGSPYNDCYVCQAQE
jgi:hypothetical protein